MRWSDVLRDRLQGISRRALLRGAGLAAGAAPILSRPPVLAAAATGGLEIGPNLYQSIGVRPVINAKGTFTIVSGSTSLPEVKQAMMEAGKQYVHLDELMDAVGRRLAELTQAEWGIVTNGCAAALTHATAACIAGADPEKLQRIPNLTGLKSEVIAPRYSRNVYDHAIRMLGIKMIDVADPDQLRAAINARTAMIMVLASPEADREPLSTATVCRIARERNVPVIVDAAAENLTIPNKHLGAGANLVAYSGGKCLRGPQAAGLLLGQKDLVRAAWLHSAPHHAFGRSLKCGKEEIMGMLAAVEMWVKRDHDAEYKAWEGWNEAIAKKVTAVPGVTTKVHPPDSLSNHAPVLSIHWDGGARGITGREVEKLLLDGDPRIVLASASGDRRGSLQSSVSIMPYMMAPSDHRVIAERLYAVLSNPPQMAAPARPEGPPANVGGQWNLELRYFAGTARHTLVFEQKEGSLQGTHRGDVLTGDLRGTVEGSEVRFHSRHRIEGTSLDYSFTGRLEGEELRGTVLMGEYGSAEWTARKHRYTA